MKARIIGAMAAIMGGGIASRMAGGKDKTVERARHEHSLGFNHTTGKVTYVGKKKNGGRPSGAAALKRAAVKRANKRKNKKGSR